MLTYAKSAILHARVKWMKKMVRCGSIVAQDRAIIGHT